MLLASLTSSLTLPFDSAIAALYTHSLNVFSVNAIVSVLFVIVVCYTMPQTHLRSIKDRTPKLTSPNDSATAILY
jgi:hypothetical protein